MFNLSFALFDLSANVFDLHTYVWLSLHTLYHMISFQKAPSPTQFLDHLTLMIQLFSQFLFIHIYIHRSSTRQNSFCQASDKNQHLSRVRCDKLRPNGLPISRRKRATRTVKMPTISR